MTNDKILKDLFDKKITSSCDKNNIDKILNSFVTLALHRIAIASTCTG